MAVYLLHSTKTVGTTGSASARHYLGCTITSRVLPRLIDHQIGRNSPAMIKAFHRSGAFLIPTHIWWDGGRGLERYLKTRGHFRRLCPVCHPEVEAGRLGEEWLLSHLPSSLDWLHSTEQEREAVGVASLGMLRKDPSAFPPQPETAQPIAWGWRVMPLPGIGGTSSRVPAQPTPSTAGASAGTRLRWRSGPGGTMR